MTTNMLIMHCVGPGFWEVRSGPLSGSFIALLVMSGGFLYDHFAIVPSRISPQAVNITDFPPLTIANGLPFNPVPNITYPVVNCTSPVINLTCPPPANITCPPPANITCLPAVVEVTCPPPPAITPLVPADLFEITESVFLEVLKRIKSGSGDFCETTTLSISPGSPLPTTVLPTPFLRANPSETEEEQALPLPTPHLSSQSQHSPPILLHKELLEQFKKLAHLLGTHNNECGCGYRPTPPPYLPNSSPAEIVVHWRMLGTGQWQYCKEGEGGIMECEDMGY